MDPTSLIILGLAVIVGGFSMMRSTRRVSASRARDIRDEVQTEMTASRASVTNQIRQMEVRLLERTRDLEGELTTRAAMLDQLITEADERIAQLRSELDAFKAADGDCDNARRAA